MSFALAQYRTTRVVTASPLEVVVSLYEGACRFLREAITKGESGDVPGRAHALNRAHAIVSELELTLDHERAPELCAQLASLYEFVVFCIREATLSGDATKVRPALEVLDSLRSAWAELASRAP